VARLFISHSSRDNVYALAFQSWLAANGWDRDDVFIDLHDIGAGERWRETLRKANAACEAVILLASPESLSSIECQKEIELAEALGKEIITAVIRDLAVDDPRLARYSERQLVDLAAFPRDHVEALAWQGQEHRIGFNPAALARLKGRLTVLGISPGSFSWPPRDRPNAEPYPGLSAFDEDDAGIFFGRDADIMAALTEIRLVRRRRAPRLIVIDAASGAGKSSFLRAGLWPRLKRDPDFAPLALLRPSQGLITGPDGLGRRMAPFFERHQQPRGAGSIYAPLMAEDEARAAGAFAALMAEAVALATQARRAGNPEAAPPAPLIAIDQAEEMLAAEHAAESARFLAMLTAFLAAPPAGVDPYVLMTIRADSVQGLLDRVAELGLETPKALYLPPLSPAAYREVILRPAEVYSARVKRLAIEPLLADDVVRDATGADALPLLAFTLARLFGDFAAEGRLTHEGYVAMGGIAGSIQRALAEARTKAGAAGTEAHLRRLLIPALVTWDPDADAGKGAAKRLPALLAGPRSELGVLAQALVDVRLLRRDRETLEVAHEALLRIPPISDWLEEDREFLIWRDRTARARAAYEANARGLLVGRELDIARGWMEARSDTAEIAEPERAFIAASAAAEEKRRSAEAARERAFQTAQLDASRAREQAAELELTRAREREAAAQERAVAARRTARRTFAGLLVASLLALAASGAGWLAYVKQGEAEQNAAMAERNAAMAEQERREAVAQRQVAEAQSQKAHEADQVVQVLYAQTVNDVEKTRSREERDKEIYTRLQREVAKGNVTATLYAGLLTFYGQGVPRDYAKAREWYEKAAAAGHPRAMANIGVLYVNGEGVPRDYARAREWYDKAIAAGNAAAMTNMGVLYMNGWGVPLDYARAREWYEKAIAAGDDRAMNNVGLLYQNGWGVPQDYARAREWYEKAVAAGNAGGMTNLGFLYYNGKGVPRDYAKARDSFEQAAAAGDGSGMTIIGLYYAFGQGGLPRDYAKAREWYEKAAAAGNFQAMDQIGDLYASGKGVPQDYTKAREWYEKAATAGYVGAMRNFGLLYQNGRGVPQDYAKAREWLEKAAGGGDNDAMIDLGALSASGRGMPKDEAKAREWFEKAAAGGGNAMRSIGVLYQSGQDVPRDYAKAREWWEKAAAAGHAIAMDDLGDVYANGWGVPQDYVKAREWYEKGAAAGYVAGMRSVGLLYQNGQGVPQDYTKALEWYGKAAAAGDRTAMNDIGVFHARGWGVPQDYTKAREWYDKAAAAGNTVSLRNIGWLHSNGQGVPQDYAKAREWFEKAAAAGDAVAMNDIGLLHHRGQGVPRDSAKAREWFEKAAAAGDAYGMNNIGWLYQNGDGLPQDYAKAREWYEKAIAAGNSLAMSNMGLLYRNGQGVPQDFAKAREWFEKAAAAGDASAMVNIGVLYDLGQGMPQDFAAARTWYDKALAAGDSSGTAMLNIGWLYDNSRGVPQDYAKAREWYEKAAAAGNAVAMVNIGDLYAEGYGVPQDDSKAREWYDKAVAASNAATMRHIAELYANGQALRRNDAKARAWYQKAADSGDKEALGSVSWLALFAKEFTPALDAAERALTAEPNLLWIAMNRAHALMFLGRAEEAREVYLVNKDRRIPQNGKIWQQVIGEDFAQLRKAGLDHPQMAEIEAALGIAKP
jgi:uncharacterized protein